MLATTRLELSDLSRQKRLALDFDDDLTLQHSVGAAVQHYLHRMNIPDHGQRWYAFSRGVMLDSQSRLTEIPDESSRWTVLPEVSAGAR